MIKVLVGIQARSTSQRLPGKALERLYNKPVLSWVVNACIKSATFMEHRSNRDLQVDVAILTPVGDPISTHYSNLNIVEGDEHDVLSRYLDAAKAFSSDFIVRVTGDCPFLSAYMITNHIFKAVNFRLDYLTNADPACRTELDGRDVEVLSRKALDWLEKNATSPEDREHCTTRLREVRPPHLKRGHFLNRIDVSDIKLSIDTPEELDVARDRMDRFFQKKAFAERDVGKEHVFLS